MIVRRYADFRPIFAEGGFGGGPDANDGLQAWSPHLVRANDIPPILGMPTPVVSFPATLTINALAVDVGGVEYDWYLSQRTDTPERRLLDIEHPTPTQSGTVVLSLTARGVAELGLANATDEVDEDALRRVFKHCDLYARRRSDEAIQRLDLLAATLGA